MTKQAGVQIYCDVGAAYACGVDIADVSVVALGCETGNPDSNLDVVAAVG